VAYGYIVDENGSGRHRRIERQKKMMIDADGMANRERLLRGRTKARHIRGVPRQRADRKTVSLIVDRMRWNAIAERFADMPGEIVNGVELGMYKGINASHLLKLLPNLHLTAVDLWRNVEQATGDNSLYWGYSPDEWEQTYKQASGKVEFARDRCNILRMPTAEAATSFDDNSLDFVFVDADHTYAGCIADCRAWYSKIKHGGWLCGHDYGDKGHGKERWNKPEVKQAVDEFAAEIGAFVDTDCDGTWFIRKLDEKPIVVSFAYDDDDSGYYHKSADELEQSCKRLGLECRIKRLKRIQGVSGLTGRDRWLAIARKKIQFIQTEMKRNPARHLIWADCDIVLDRVPYVDMQHDLTLVEYTKDATQTAGLAYTPEYVSAFIGFNNTRSAKLFVNMWHNSEQSDDHIAFDELTEMGTVTIKKLHHSYCWRGGADISFIVARTNKRNRTKTVKSNAEILTVAFGNVIKPLMDAHVKSVREMATGANHVLCLPDPPENPRNDRPAWASPNNHKLKFWRDYVRDNQGKEVVLMDADTVLLKDIRRRFDESPDFDICFTDRVDKIHPINGGIVFVRCNPKTLAFFEAWVAEDDRLYNDTAAFKQAQRIAAGMNQASLGVILADNRLHGCKVDYAPCQIWNAVNSHWRTFNEKECYCLHIKGGGLREYVMHGNCNTKWFADRYVELMKTWNRFAPVGYLRPVIVGGR